MRRYHITLGASTTAGGKVTSASSHGSINGARIALEGDTVACPACKTTGKIACVAPRIPESWNGKQVALEDDFCICGCAPPPKLKPSQRLKCQVIDDVAPAARSAREKPAVLEEDDQEVIEQFFSLLDEQGHAVQGFRYDLYLNDTIYAKASRYEDGNTVAVPGGGGDLSLVTWFNIDGASRHG
jgi:uncharacterized Zn-binding protein involved in type VI secretion